MRQVWRALFAVALFLSCSAVAAEALSVRDVIELSKAGVSDQVLLALIDVDHRVYTLDAAALKELKDAGVSETVVIAMIRAGRGKTPAVSAPSTRSTTPSAEGGELLNPQESAADATEPQVASSSSEPRVIVIDHHDAADQGAAAPYAVAVPYPVYLSAPAHHSRRAFNAQRVPTFQAPNYPLGTVAPQQPFLTNSPLGVSYPVPNYPLGTVAPQQPFLSVPQPIMRAPICEPRLSAGGATTVVCR